jgi:putative membrane protein
MAIQHDHGVAITKSTGPRFVVRLLINALGLWIAARLSRNIDYQDSLAVIAVAALIFSLINAVLRPIVIILSLPAIILTLGFFMLVINGFMVWLVSVIYPSFEVRTFGAAVMAAIIIWIVNYGLSVFFSRQTVTTHRN